MGNTSPVKASFPQDADATMPRDIAIVEPFWRYVMNFTAIKEFSRKSLAGVGLALGMVPMLGFSVLAQQSGGYNNGGYYPRPGYGQNGGYRDRDRDRDGYRDRDRYRNNYNYLRRLAADNGYQSGLEHGLKDRRRSHRYDYTDSDSFRHADHGYRREYGDKEEYRRIFRDAFIRGYNQGYGTRGWGGRY
jgi:hypothetical protein